MRYALFIILISFSTQSAELQTLSKRENAMLEVIAYAEGTGKEYNIIYGYKRFDSYSSHPRRTVCSNGYCSTAAGRYQFIASTWDYICRILKLEDFSPKNQDIAALFLVYSKGVEVDRINNYELFKQAIYKLNMVWASFPLSPYKQPTRKMKDLYKIWRKYER